MRNLCCFRGQGEVGFSPSARPLLGTIFRHTSHYDFIIDHAPKGPVGIFNNYTSYPYQKTLLEFMPLYGTNDPV